MKRQPETFYEHVINLNESNTAIFLIMTLFSTAIGNGPWWTSLLCFLRRLSLVPQFYYFQLLLSSYCRRILFLDPDIKVTSHIPRVQNRSSDSFICSCVFVLLYYFLQTSYLFWLTHLTPENNYFSNSRNRARWINYANILILFGLIRNICLTMIYNVKNVWV